MAFLPNKTLSSVIPDGFRMAALDLHRAELVPLVRAGMSISTFRKFCLENFGKPPGEVLTEFRMNNARGLLLYRELSIDEIALQLGYADRFTFAKAFTQFHRCTPTAFRQKSNPRKS